VRDGYEAGADASFDMPVNPGQVLAVVLRLIA